MEARKITVVAKTLPPKLGGQPPVPTGGQAARTTQPSLPAVGTKSGAVQSQDPKAAQAQPKKKLKDVDWSQKGYFDGDGLQKSGEVEKPQDSAPKRGRTLVIPAIQEPQPQPQAQVEGKGAWAEAESPSTHDAKEARETQKGREADAKAAAEKRSLGGSPMAARKTEKLAMQPPPLPGADKPKGTLYELLENAKEPGTLYTEDDEGGGDGGEQEEEDPELMEAVEECIQRLFGVRGIHHIGPGTNDAGEKVIIIATSQGFGEESMRRVPSEVRGFKTLVALPFDLLPLKRTGPR
jgi:hypothetical protein